MESPTKRDWAEAIDELRLKEHSLQYMQKWTGMDRSVFYYHRSHK
ncbi:hypothetical protein [Segatella oris]|nr:hypothetical protein [Segatella oris]